jgi:hypothetical protein
MPMYFLLSFCSLSCFSIDFHWFSMPGSKEKKECNKKMGGCE